MSISNIKLENKIYDWFSPTVHFIHINDTLANMI